MELIVTRSIEDCRLFVEALGACEGLTVRTLPLIECEAVPFVVPKLVAGDALIFTSRRGVESFKAGLSGVSINSNFKFFAQGPRTAKAVRECFGAVASTFPDQVSEEMGYWIAQQLRPGARVFVISPDCGRRAVSAVLRQSDSLEVLDICTYRTVHTHISASERSLIQETGELMAVFFSPSAVASWHANGLCQPFYVASFGPVTSAAIRELGWSVSLECTSNLLSDFVKSLVGFVKLIS